MCRRAPDKLTEKADIHGLSAAAHLPDEAATRCFELYLAALSPLSLRDLFNDCAIHMPDVLRLLLPRALSPLGAELFTARMEAADERCAEAEKGAFYARLYGALGDDDAQSAFLSRLLDLKDAFAHEALRSVARGVLGIAC